MRILIICHTMTYLSGSPLYNYTLALELKKQGHDVSVLSMWADNKLRNNLGKSKIMTCYTKAPEGMYDLVIISQSAWKDSLDHIKAKKIINVVHSQYDVETPITDKRIDCYIAIRPEIKEHLIFGHNIPENIIKVIYNGIDFERFSHKKRKIHKGSYTKIVLPCTLDMLRKRFIEFYTRRASEKYRIHIYGKD